MFNFESDSAFVQKRSSKWLGGLGRRNRTCLSCWKRPETATLNNGTRVVLIFWLFLCPESPFHFEKPSLFFLFFINPFREKILVLFVLWCHYVFVALSILNICFFLLSTFPWHPLLKLNCFHFGYLHLCFFFFCFFLWGGGSWALVSVALLSDYNK